MSRRPRGAAGTRPGAAVSCRRVTQLYAVESEQVVALRDVDLDVAPGASLALLGPSGSGKSTLLSLLAGLRTPTTGTVVVGGIDLTGDDRDAGRRLRSGVVGLLLQDPGRVLLPFATGEQVLRRAGDGDPRRTLDRFRLSSVAHQPVSSMSSGQQQRLALAQTMARRPALLLADEPTSRVDPAARDEVLGVLHGSVRDSGATLILVTHDPVVAGGFSDTVTMRDGRVGTLGRDGEEFAVVAPDGSLTLPQRTARLLPPGSRVRVELEPDAVRLRPVREERP